MNKIQIILSTLAIMVFTACETTFYDEEQYRKEIYIVSYDNNIFGQEYTYGEGSTGYISIYAAGTTPIDRDVTVEIEVYPDYLRNFNKRVYGEDYTHYAKELDPADYQIESMTTTLKAGSKEPYVQLPIRVNINNLDPDGEYYIPLRIKSVSDYMISPDKQNVLYRVYVKNDYATTKSTTYYTMNGTEQKFTITNGVYTPSEAVTTVNATKPVVPTGQYTIRMLPNAMTNDALNNSMNIHVFPTEMVDVPVYVEGVATGQTVKRQKVELTTWIESSQSLIIKDLEGIDIDATVNERFSYYDPETKRFTLNYRYKSPGEDVWHFMHEEVYPLKNNE